MQVRSAGGKKRARRGRWSDGSPPALLLGTRRQLTPWLGLEGMVGSTLFYRKSGQVNDVNSLCFLNGTGIGGELKGKGLMFVRVGCDIIGIGVLG